MTIDQFRSHPEWPAQWRKELENNAILRLVLQVCEDNHPDKSAIEGDNDGDVSATRAAIELGVIRGYSRYSKRLQFLAQQKAPQFDVGPPTYDQPQVKEEAHA